mgnify:CR=1 FL=1
MIELKNIDVTFQNGSHEFKAVDNVSLKINKGEIFGIVGPSGAGKSTLVRVINLLQRPTNGEVIIEGSDITKFNRKQLRKTRLNIGMIFQHFNLISGSTIAENVAFSLYANNYPKDKIKDRVKELLEIVHLPEKADAYPANLSGGQKQRVAIGSAIMRRPKAFLMDEPLSNLDAKLRAQMRVELAKLHKELKTTVIYVTHDQTEAMTLGTKIIVMKDGVVQQVDTPQNLYQKPGNLFVAGFMGSPQMNFLDAVISEKGGNVVATIGGEHEVIVPAAKAKVLKDKGYVGKKVVLGIRPEDIHDSQMFLETSPSKPMNSVVKVYELLGAEVFLYFDVDGTQVTARVDPRTTAKTGDPIRFAFDMEKAHFFDKETELTITN